MVFLMFNYVCMQNSYPDPHQYMYIKVVIRILINSFWIRYTYTKEWVLTFCAVSPACQVLLPAGQADLLPISATRVVTKVVVARLADDVTVPAVVGLSAHQPVVVF